ncbi:DUF3667 domain-containing protein [Microbulbifer donghaiensis]|uniref:DUF3667 domain-containing protein n=1 Tax=Microbulbifer donghaiensis TaxID=494016 RepID=UPI000934831B|nr:DUF3667 domain-containing protein [Microbulbifer donghaiensis]
MSSSPEAAGSPAQPPAQCANCGTQLLGPHCYACGQPVKGLVRHFSSILGDFFDTLLALDSRITRTLGPLISRPGYLTAEYFAGRRVRYVSPVRLFIFLCLTTFFIVQLSSDWNISDYDSEMSRAASVEEVEQLRDKTLAELAKARADSDEVAAAREGLKLAELKVRQQADVRIAQLQGKELIGEESTEGSEGESTADTDADDFCLVGLGDGCWDPGAEPVNIDGLPTAVNDWLTVQAVKANNNLRITREEPNRFKKAFLGAIPSTLIVLLPLFALILWVLYLFQRRLYMEHLIVALHSHAFLCLALLLVTLLADVQAWLETYGLIDAVCAWAIGLLCLWMPIYLLLMQKRVYGQGWGSTLVKFLVLGVSYSVLLALGATFTVLSSLAWL